MLFDNCESQFPFFGFIRTDLHTLTGFNAQRSMSSVQAGHQIAAEQALLNFRRADVGTRGTVNLESGLTGSGRIVSCAKISSRFKGFLNAVNRACATLIANPESKAYGLNQGRTDFDRLHFIQFKTVDQ